MAWYFAHPRIRIRKKKPDGDAASILDRLERYLQDFNGPVSLLCGFWADQRDAISYDELRTLAERGYLDEETLDEWRQDYTHLVTERMPEIWGDAMLTGSTSQPVMDHIASDFVFDPTRKAALDWVRSRGAQLVTNCTETQKNAIAALLEDQVRNQYSPDELAKLIRPCIGLTKGQASAVRNFYDNLVKTLTEEHPRTSPEKIRARARERAQKYAERLHRQRAATIAQTEMAYAYNFGADEGVRQAQENHLLGKCVKRWCTSGDSRVCKKCDALNGTEVGMDEAFFTESKAEDDETGLYPPLHPNCACAVQYIEVEPPIFRPSDKTGLTREGADDILTIPEEKEGADVHYVGKIDRDLYSCVTSDITTDEVIITEERIQHIKERHPGDYETYVGYIKQIIESPDYILEANKPNTAFLLKTFDEAGERFELILRLKICSDPLEYKNSVITFLRIKEKKWNKYLRNKKILYKKE